jgi:hypothetical protein
MQYTTITLEDFKAKSHNKNSNAFDSGFVSEVSEIVNANKGKCLQLVTIEDAMKSYKGSGNAKPSKIVATFFIQILKKSGYKDASKNRVSVNKGMINLRL